MAKEERSVCFDEQLQVEAYCFKGIMQKFPNHFHEHYVIGFIENGKRHLSCMNRDYEVSHGDLLLFNPMMNHTCEQMDKETLDYRCINIKTDVMKKIIFEIAGKDHLIQFAQPVVFNCEHISLLKELHQMIMEEEKSFRKEEIFYFLIKELIDNYSKEVFLDEVDICDKIQKSCTYMEENFKFQITLDDLSGISNMNKYTLLRSFVREKGLTPYQYLETLRINYAKELLEKGTPPIEVAIESGFTDQSHFTKYFKNFIGLTPKQYQNIFKDNK